MLQLGEDDNEGQAGVDDEGEWLCGRQSAGEADQGGWLEGDDIEDF